MKANWDAGTPELEFNAKRQAEWDAIWETMWDVKWEAELEAELDAVDTDIQAGNDKLIGLAVKLIELKTRASEMDWDESIEDEMDIQLAKLTAEIRAETRELAQLQTERTSQRVFGLMLPRWDVELQPELVGSSRVATPPATPDDSKTLVTHNIETHFRRRLYENRLLVSCADRH